MNKTALITGANKGIGLGISKYLGLSGWDIIIGARNEARALETMNKLKDAGCTVLGWVKIELCDLDGISLATKEINDKYPSLNLLVNNITVPSEISPYWHPLAYVASKAAQNAMMGVMAMEFEQNNIPVEIFSVHPGPTTTDLNGNMALPGFHTIDTVGEKFAKLINDGQSHNGEFIELYPIVKED